MSNLKRVMHLAEVKTIQELIDVLQKFPAGMSVSGPLFENGVQVNLVEKEDKKTYLTFEDS